MKKQPYPTTQLNPYKAHLEDGNPHMSGHHRTFHPEAHSFLFCVAMDYSWFGFGGDKNWATNYADGILAFFGTDNRLFENGGWNFEQNGQVIPGNDGDDEGEVPTTLRSFLTALAPMCSNEKQAKTFVNDLWGLEYIRSIGERNKAGRGYDYFLALLHLSGQYRIIGPDWNNGHSNTARPCAPHISAVNNNLTSAHYDLRGRQVDGKGTRAMCRGILITDITVDGRSGIAKKVTLNQ